MDYSQLFAQAGKQFNVDPLLAQAVMGSESAGNPNAVSPKGANGLMQLMPGTAADMGVTDSSDPAQNIFGGVKYLGQMLDKYGSVPLALAAYNAGPGAVDKHGGIPPFPETQNYVKSVSGKYQALQGNPMPQMPGLPPTSTAGTAQIDPFAGMPAGPTAPAQAGAMIDPFAGLSGKPENAAAAPAPTLWDNLTRQAGLTARAAVTGLTGLPTLAGDALNSGINLATGGINSVAGTNIPKLQMPSAVVQQGLNSAGVPQPQNGTERVVQDAASAGFGVPGFTALGGALTKAASPIAQAVGTGLQALPGMQMVGAAGAGTGSGVARENGAGPTGQILAGLLGGGIGAVAPSAALSVARGLQGATEGAAGIVQPWTNPQSFVGKGIASTLGDEAPTAAANIRNASELVPGSMPTTAQAGGTAPLVATEKAFANANGNFKNALATREANNNGARWDSLNQVAGSPDDMAAALATRTNAAKPLYESAHAQTANVDNDFVQFAQRPAMVQAMQQADNLAKNEGVNLQWPTPDNPAISGQALDYTTRALSDLIDTAKRSGSNQQVRALTGTKDALQSWTEQQIPAVKLASQSYAENSVPVNTMEAGQQMADALSKNARDVLQQPQITKQSYQSNLAKALKNQPYGIAPEAQTQLDNIAADLQRATGSNALKSPGSDTAYNLTANGWLGKQIYGEGFGGATGLGKGLGALGATLSGHPYVGLGILSQGNKLGVMAGDRLKSQLSELLLNPSLLLPYLDAAKSQAIAPSLRSNVAAGLIGAGEARSP